jgi:hypothetical protein
MINELAIKEWLNYDAEIIQLDAKLKELKRKKKEYAQQIMQNMDEVALDAFNIKGGQIIYQKKNVKKQFTKNHLIALLQEYFKDEPEEADALYEYLQTNREIKVEEKLVRTFTN